MHELILPSPLHYLVSRGMLAVLQNYSLTRTWLMQEKHRMVLDENAVVIETVAA